MRVKEGLRRSRLGDLRRLFLDRYGLTLPDADDGREDLHEILLVASLAYNPDRAMLSEIARWAPWLDKAGVAQIMDDVNRTPVFLRFRSAREMADRMRLTDCDRHRLAITTIRPFDVTDEELERRRKAKDAERKWRNRRAAEKKDREAWLANRWSRLKPWEKRKPPMSRASWYREGHHKQAEPVRQVRETGVSATKFNTVKDRLVSVESQRSGNSRKGVAISKTGARGRKAGRG
jgi:hypothetical protein